MLLALILAAVQSPFLWIPTTRTQSTKAVCQTQFDWMTNSKGQNPCLVTSWLWLPCYGPAYSNVPAAHSPDWIYDGPQDTDEYHSTACDCNTVLYSTFAACAVCQGVNIDPWPIYKTNCTKVFVATYPEPIPDGTAIPAWAFLDVTRNSIFNITAAKALAVQHVPDITANSSLSASSTTYPHSSTAVLSVTAIAPPSTSGGAEIGGATGGKRSGSIIAPIVGGCVGGALGILAIGVFAFYILLRYRKAGQGSRNLKYGVSGTGSAERSTSISHKGASIGMLYDANDPRTFPPPFIAPDASSSEVSSLPVVGGTAARVGNEPLISFYKGFPQL